MVDDDAQCQLDPLGGPRGENNAVRRHFQAARRVLGRHCDSRLHNPGAWGVAVSAIAHGAGHSLYEVRRGLEAEQDGVTDIQIVHTATGFFYLVRFRDNISDRVVEPLEPPGDWDRRDRIHRHIH